MPHNKTDNNHSNTPKNQLKLQNGVVESESSVDEQSSRFSKSRVLVSRLKRRVLKHVYLLRFLIFFLFLALLFLSGVSAYKWVKSSQIGFYVSLAKNFLQVPTEQVESIDNRVNILVLGKGGEGHEAPDLTDTVILLSVSRTPTKKIFSVGSESNITMISLPRDIWIAPLRTKLNSIYYWGNQKQAEGGLLLAKSTVEEISGQPVQYGVVVDFNGFKKIIDVLGGIEVDVQNSFTDDNFPIPGRENDLCSGDKDLRCRYESITFQKGEQSMSGETALKFVRSRQAEGDEGTDFARSARQELIIEAIKNKILSKEVYLNPRKLIELKDTILESIETDISPETGAVLARWFLEGRENVSSYVLSEELLENPPKLPQYDNLYVFVPKEINQSNPALRSWTKVQEWIECILVTDNCI